MPEPTEFTERPNSAKGLFARFKLASGAIAYRDNIATIGYTVTKLSDSSQVTGTLDPDDVMFNSLQTPWDADEEGAEVQGYAVKWEAPGSLWPAFNESYLIEMAFTGVEAVPLIYKLAWLCRTPRR